MPPAIRVQNLSKRYRIGTRRHSADFDLRDAITEGAKGLWRRFRGHGSNGNGNGAADDDFWALKDVSFDVQPGEVIGIIGRNGAGKSTLLKILSRVVEPTSGRAEYRGRVGSLLEVGTGFHPELTGRENVYLNGSLLGMSRREISRKFDEIVAFSQIEQFLDTPVKRYSSGMYVRLAFAVAAHLEPEILIVDEVLAVGDIEFQKKCLSKMQDVAELGRTVVFVSHNVEAVRVLTHRSVVLNSGTVAFVGDTNAALATYFRMAASGHDARRSNQLEVYRRSRPDGQPATIQSVRVNGLDNPVVSMLDDIVIEMAVVAHRPLDTVGIDILIQNEIGNRVAMLYANSAENKLRLAAGLNRFQCYLPRNPFTPGRYTIEIGVHRTPSELAWDVVRGFPVFVVVVGHEVVKQPWPDRAWGDVHLEKVTWNQVHQGCGH